MEIAPQKKSWQQALRDSLRTAEDLVQAGLIARSEAKLYQPVLEKFQFLLPQYYANLIDRQNPDCPIRKQAIPDLRELRQRKGFADPLGDLNNQPVDRITHRYRNRLLLHLTPNCSMYCRYCFRKTLLNEMSPELFHGGLDAAFAYISEHPEVDEVIFSGGDPFLVSDGALRTAISRLSFIAHLKRIRFHTRVPVTFPTRISSDLVESLKSRIPVIVVAHYNHPKEVTAESKAACERLQQAGFTLLNQSVLLRGVNDKAEVLVRLSESLFSMHVLPYYLHHPDAAEGTDHFALSKEEGLGIYNEMRRRLPGYLVPRYVWDDGSDRFKAFVCE